MKKIFILLFGLFLLTPLYAQDSSEGIKTWVEEEDGSPSIIVYKLKVGNSELTDNADGTASLAGGSGDITTVGDITSGAAFDGTQGNTLTFKGATSGTTALKPTAIAGTTIITLPAETGTACTTGSVCSGYQAGALTGDVVTSGATATIQANSVALTTDTTGNYAAGDAEAGGALTGDSATSFFSTGTLEVAIGGTGTTTSTGTGAVVLGTSPTLITPALGTPSALVLTNATGLPAASVLAGTFGTG
ncbi:MAG: hypothetical protein UX38_C0029G0001, partial [Microgenomates group bacterium GW2011_GWC1_46_16]